MRDILSHIKKDGMTGIAVGKMSLIFVPNFSAFRHLQIFVLIKKNTVSNFENA